VSRSPEPLIDREHELAELRRLADRDGPALGLLYGRRRVGKTYLLDHAWPDRRVFYFLAADVTPSLNRLELLRELAMWSGQPLDPADYPTWRTIIRLFVDLATEEPLIVVLDEFQYLMGGDDDVVSQLAAVWDREMRGRPLLLMLCGSEVATLEGLQQGGQPLYGRPTWSARLRPFDYRDAAAMLPGHPPRAAATLYGALGGTPRFLAAVDGRETLAEAVTRTVLSPRGEVHLQVQHIIEQEKGIRDPAAYRAVLAAIAGGMTEINGIAQRAGFAGRPYVVRRALATLERLDLIERERNFDAPARAPFWHRIADNAVRFWYAFVHPNRSRLEWEGAADVWAHAVEPGLNDYMGGVFPRICRDAYRRRHVAWGLPGAAQWARWEGQDRNRRSIELDIVARLDDGRILTGEVKWSSRPIGYGLHHQVLRNLDDLSRSGQGWARDALAPARSAGHIYFSAAGFDDEFTRRAAQADSIRLVDLADLYRDG
jgi:AAA+ ATPase superfamily predicted ATPase